MLNETMLQEFLSEEELIDIGEQVPFGDLLDAWREAYSRFLLDRFEDAPFRSDAWRNLFRIVRPHVHPREEEVIAMMRRKHHDYGGGSLVECGEAGVFVRGFDKLHRVLNLSRIEEAGRSAQIQESKQDAIDDLFNYVILGFLLVRGGVTEDVRS